MKLTSVKVLPTIYDKFKFSSDITLQKLVNRSMDLYIKDKTFRQQITEYTLLKVSGSALWEIPH